MIERRALIALAVAPLAAGCTVVSGLDDIAFDATTSGSGSTTTGVGGAGGGTTLPCTEPVAGMTIATSTRLCAGTHAFAVADDGAALDVVADDVELECDGTVLDGGGQGKGAQGTGIRVGPFQRVTVSGCSAKGYRHGLVATGAAELVVEGVHLDDNYDDPDDEAFLSEDRPGGGLLLDGVSGGLVTGSTMARNWNGIELRGGSRQVVVTDNVADHASNTGVLLLDSHDCEIVGNDVSWAVRGSLTYPDAWYEQPTYDAAGIILDEGASGNVLRGNDARWGGDGVFIRGLFGACPHDNRILDNDVSYSPHNGIECTCDDVLIEGNKSLESNYGIWMGGSDRTTVRDNEIDASRVDGISIQVWENHHTLVQDNEILHSGRVGLLLAGRELQQSASLSPVNSIYVASTHVLVQHNVFDGNAKYDVYVTTTSSFVAASDCGPGGAAPHIQLGPEVLAPKIFGSCQEAGGKAPPTAALAAPAVVALGDVATLDASASAPSPDGGTLAWTWLVQAAAWRYYPAGPLPTPLVAGDGAAVLSVPMTAPGLFDVAVTVDDGLLAAQAWRQLAVVPEGKRVGEHAADWVHGCTVPTDDCTGPLTDEAGGFAGTMVHYASKAAYADVISTPPQGDLGLDASAYDKLGFFVRARNDNLLGWQVAAPVVVLGGPTGTLRYEPVLPLLPIAGGWAYIEIPLAGGGGWTRTDMGGALSAVDRVEVATDSFGGDGYDIWIDAMTFY